MSVAALGVDVGGSKILAVALTESGDVLDVERAATPHVVQDPAGDAVARAVVDVVNVLASRHGMDSSALLVGVGLPGMMSHDGVLVFAPNLPSMNGVNLAAAVRRHAPRWRVWCENDADCAVHAEHQSGAARGHDNVVMVTLGTGIGGGIIASGQLVRGRSGFAGEIGHMVVDARGPRCPCGGRGCWERFASGAGVARLAREAAAAGRLPTLVARAEGDIDAVRGEDVTRAAAQGLDEALEVIEEVGWWLALGIANLAAILDCGLFVLGGGLAEASALLVPSAQRHLDGLVEGAQDRPAVAIVPAHFAECAGAVGAALLAQARHS